MRIDYLTYFGGHICSYDSAEFNASKIIEKYQGLTQQMGLGMLSRRRPFK